MAADPIEPDEPSGLDDPSSDLLDAVRSDRSEADFWTEADAARSGSLASRARSRRHQPRHHRADPAPAPSSLRGRAAAAWAAEVSAMRALRRRSSTDGTATSHRARRVGIVLATIAALALLASVTDLDPGDGSSSEAASAADGGAAASDRVSTSDQRGGEGGADEDPDVASQLVDVGSARQTDAAPTTTTTRPEARADDAPAAQGGTGPRSAAPTPSPAGPTPPAAAPPAPAPAPATPTPTPPAPTPTTAPPKAPAAPRIGSFTATTAALPGGACPAAQWATTFAWSTTDATAVQIGGTLAETYRGLPADGSRVVCRALPLPPLGGWLLTATGPGGTATALA